MLMQQEREAIVQAGRILFEHGLVQLSGGNISIRNPEDSNMIAIKPSGVPYYLMRPEDIAIVDLNGKMLEGTKKPSTETPMHTNVYKVRPDVNAVVHCHAPSAVAWSLKGKKFIPTVEICQYMTRGAIKVAPYADSGSQKLADVAAQYLGKEEFAIVLEGHGILCAGPDLQYALEEALVVEDVAKISILCDLMQGNTIPMGERLGKAEGFDESEKLKGLL